MKHGLVKLLVGMVFGALGLLPVVGVVFLVLAGIWLAWGCLILLAHGVFAVVGDDEKQVSCSER